MGALADRRPGRIKELDGLRAFAVLSVVVYHFLCFSTLFPKPSDLTERFLAAIGKGGVDVFFVISGYIISLLLLREWQGQGSIALSKFYLRRFFRIVPPFAVFLAAVLVLRALGRVSIPGKNVVAAASFLTDTTFFGLSPFITGHTWSLSVEEQFYLFFPPLLCLVFCYRFKPLAVCLGLIYASSLLSLKVVDEIFIRFGAHWETIGALLAFRHIIAGVLLALYGSRVLSYLSHRSRILPLALVAVSITLRMLHVSAAPQMLIAAIEPILLAAFVAWFIQNPERCAVLRWPAIQWTGLCSYSIYLWQQPFTGPDRFFRSLGPAELPVSILAIFIFATASSYFIERPSIRLGKYFSGRLRKSEILAAPLVADGLAQ